MGHFQMKAQKIQLVKFPQLITGRIQPGPQGPDSQPALYTPGLLHWHRLAARACGGLGGGLRSTGVGRRVVCVEACWWAVFQIETLPPSQISAVAPLILASHPCFQWFSGSWSPQLWLLITSPESRSASCRPGGAQGAAEIPGLPSPACPPCLTPTCPGATRGCSAPPDPWGRPVHSGVLILQNLQENRRSWRKGRFVEMVTVRGRHRQKEKRSEENQAP